MKLDRATPGDAPAMAAVHAASFAAPWSAEDIKAALGGPGGFGLVIRDADILAAFALAHALLEDAELLTLAVDPRRRRRGAGAALVEAVAAHAAAGGAERLFLEVAADNAAALALYRAAGFADVGRRGAYYPRDGGAVDALVMRRELNRPAA